MRFLFLLAFLVCNLASGAQDANTQLFQDLIPPGYTILDTAFGDLNRDAYADAVVILKSGAEEAYSDSTRPLLLLAGTATGSYRLLARNDSVVLCSGCGGVFGDPYAGITIKNSYFSIEHYGGSNWRWTRIITFKFDPANHVFRLHRDAGVSFHTSNPDKTKDIIHNKPDFGKRLFAEYTYTKGL